MARAVGFDAVKRVEKLFDRVVRNDYDGDGKTDIAMWRETEGNFYILKTTGSGETTFVNWGFTTDQPIAAYDVH